MRSLFYIVILLIVTGCRFSSSQTKVLDEAQCLMHSDPDAALSKLNAVDVSEFQDSATMARWALLYSEAIVVNRLSVPNDTIVNIAIDYYGRHHLNDEFRKASSLKVLIQASGRSDTLATALYLQKEKEFLLYKERAKRETYMLVGLVVLLIAAGIIVWLRQRIKLQTLQNEALMAEASGLKSQIDASRGDVGRLELKLRGLLENRFALIDSLCQTYYESQGTKIERKAIVDKVKSEIESVRTDSFHEMEKVVNDCCDNLLVKVREAYPDIKPENYQLLVYLASGLSTRTISLLLCESVEVVYKRKSRLKARLKDLVEPVYSDIMTIF
ncbi:MAG: hypothetical protein K2H47_05235 [Muribaculaceae bacterium]|nr:hypothetical protein [Muribaculaceae bacterium]